MRCGGAGADGRLHAERCGGGDTQNNETYEHNHNENTGARLDVAVIGSPHGGADELVMRSLATKEFKASYTGVQQYSADTTRRRFRTEGGERCGEPSSQGHRHQRAHLP